MKPTQASQQASHPQPKLKEMGVAEVVAMALYIHRKRVRKGKLSRRVSFSLPPHVIPPNGGEYDSFLGRVRIRTAFSIVEGRWFVEVVLPPQEGFQLKDYPSPEELRELNDIVDRLGSK